MKNEPVVTGGAIIGAIMAIATFAVAMGWLDWTTDQMTAFQAMIAALVPLLIVVGGSFIVRRFTYGPETVEKIRAGEID